MFRTCQFNELCINIACDSSTSCIGVYVAKISEKNEVNVMILTNTFIFGLIPDHYIMLDTIGIYSYHMNVIFNRG